MEVAVGRIQGVHRRLEEDLPRLTAAHEVPGASVAVLVDGQVGGGHRRRGEPADGRCGDTGFVVHDPVDHQGLDRDVGHAARR